MIACEREVLLDVSRHGRGRRRRRRPDPKLVPPYAAISSDRSPPFSHRFDDRYDLPGYE